MGTVLAHNNKILISNGVAISHEGGSSANIQEDKTYTVSASGNQTISPDSGYDAMGNVALTVPQGSLGSANWEVTKDSHCEYTYEETNIPIDSTQPEEEEIDIEEAFGIITGYIIPMEEE